MSKRLLTYTCYFYLMSYAMVVTVIGSCNSHIDAAFNAGESVMGMLISSHFIGFIVSTLGAGYLVDRTGLKPVMVGSVAVLGVSIIAFGVAPTLPLLFVAMLLTGVGGGAVESAVNALVAELHKDTRLYSLNMLHVYFGIGAFVFPTVAGYLLANGASWRSLYTFIGVFSLAMAAVMGVQRFPSVEGGETVKFSEMFSMLRKPTVILLGGVIAFYVGGEMGINVWVVRYFDEVLLHGEPLNTRLGITIGGRAFSFGVTTSVFLSLYWFTLTLGRLIVTFAGRVVPDYVLLRVITAMSAVFAVLTFAVNDVAWATAFLALTGLSFSGIFATTVAIGVNRFPERPGIISGIVIAFSGAGNVVFNTAIGQAAEATGTIRAGMLFAAALMIGMAVCAMFIGKSKDK